MKQKLIVDTDCGSDDAMAIAIALNDNNYEIMMFSTVMGNVKVEQATANLLTTLNKVNAYYPKVYVGEEKPLDFKFVGASETHGIDGMGDLDLIDYSLKPEKGVAYEMIIDTLNKHDDKQIDIVTLGPLTNLAKAIDKDINAIKKANKILCMAGQGFGEGNQTEYSEFNIYQDALACQKVIDAHLDNLYFVGWDASLGDCILNKDDINEIAKYNDLSKYIIDVNCGLLKYNIERFNNECLDMADPAAMVAYLYPKCIEECKKYYCRVEIDQDNKYYGKLYIEDNEEKANVYIVSKLNASMYKNYLKDKLKQVS